MIEPHQRFRATAIPAVVLDDWLPVSEAADLRARLLAHGLERFDIADRGRHDLSLSFRADGVLARLGARTEEVAQEPLRLAAVRWTRSRHGDYTLIHGDDLVRFADPRHVEVTLDFSAGSSDLGQIVYTDGTDVFVVPQRAGAMAVVERRPTVRRYQRYLTHRAGDAEVFRLRAAYSVVGPQGARP